jgi:BirA family biotin operon repressor/biotin-[acetyl-CoA-carboxylase] ligase
VTEGAPSASAPHLAWGAETLWQRLQPLLPGLGVEVVARCGSTNSTLIERARLVSGQPDAPVSRPGELAPAGAAGVTPHGRRAADTQPCLLVAEHQTRGRGRQGRTWQSVPGASLTFSIALPLAPTDWSGLSLAVGVALADALDPPRAGAAPRIGLKWPNDLWLLDAPPGAGTPAAAAIGRKLGGVLIETVPVGAARMCVVGVGINVLPAQMEGLASGYACLQEIDPRAGAPAALATVAGPLVRALLSFEREGFGGVAAAFARRDVLAGRAVRTTAADVAQGVAEGVDPDGALRVRDDAGVHRLVGGEVSVQPTLEGAAC